MRVYVSGLETTQLTEDGEVWALLPNLLPWKLMDGP